MGKDIGIKKEPIEMINIPNEAPIIHSRFFLSESDMRDILEQKPINCFMSDVWWIYHVVSFGIAHTLSHLFQNYVLTRAQSGMIKSWRTSDEYREVHFGNAAKKFRESGGKTIMELKRFLLSRQWQLADLGVLGIWVQESAIDPELIPDIIKEFLDD